MAQRRSQPRQPRFAARIDVDLTPNALTQALAARRAAGARILDLTASNPTQAGFDYPEPEILAALAAPGALRVRARRVRPARGARGGERVLRGAR